MSADTTQIIISRHESISLTDQTALNSQRILLVLYFSSQVFTVLSVIRSMNDSRPMFLSFLLRVVDSFVSSIAGCGQFADTAFLYQRFTKAAFRRIALSRHDTTIHRNRGW